MFPHLQSIKPIVYNHSDVEMMLGQDVFHAIKLLEYFQEGNQNTLVAVRMPIGWVLSGPLPSPIGVRPTTFKCNLEDVALADQVKKWYDLESYGTFKQADPRSSADKRAQKILDSTTIHDGSRYVVGMLWADDNIHLPDNFYASLVQFKSLEKRLEKALKLKTQYASDIRSDVEKGYVVPVSRHDLKNRSDREWYVPHHPVLNSNKPGKVRRVLNGATKFHGKSLNNSLLVGPDLLQNLLFVLMRFREHKYAICADIEGMFMQVCLLESDQRSLRFFVAGGPHIHIFGAKDSPTCANYALRRTAVDNQDRYSDAAHAVLNNFFMDDYLGSVKNPETALMINRSLVELLKLGGFNLTKFISNVPNLFSKLNPPKTSANNSKEIFTAAINPETASHVLGLKWDHVTDALVVSRGVNRELKDSVTQRSVFSFVSSVFDPIDLCY